DAFGWLLAVAALVGVSITWWARIQLGRLWSSTVTRKADHRVVDTGPYRLVRHPIYTGIIFATIATMIVAGSAFAVVGAALMLAGWYVKARLEERFLRAELGASAYDDYARRVPMLLPFVRLGR
ncbi:MAG TPA: isoprenylcysteine carboxylmethyltransferase family protein, partial [Caulobacteraceae bacterium]|nr:isoprenylcysteine carboxylmethyltransferase family protein [Caulobacteraceae bacterium]